MSRSEQRIRSYLQRAEFFGAPSQAREFHPFVCRDEKTILKIEEHVAEEYRRKGWNPGWAAVGLWYEDPHCWVVRDAVIFEGRPAIHHRLIWKAGLHCGVVMLPYREGRLVLVNHWRPPLMGSSWECPRGAIDPGESPGQAVRREIREELGAKVLACMSMGPIHPINNWTGSVVNLYMVKVSPLGKKATNEGVGEVRQFTFNEIQGMISRNLITDAPTLCALAKADWLGWLKDT